MGLLFNSIKEEDLTKNLYLYSEENHKKETILFSSENPESIQNFSKNSSKNDIPEELNKSTKLNSTYNSKQEKVKYKFIWQDNNNFNKKKEVLLTGTFLKSWDDHVIMTKKEECIYEYETYLEKKAYQFKFIINNNWLCSDLYPTQPDDSNNINNYIDLTNYIENNKNLDFSNNTINTVITQEYSELNILNDKPPQVISNYKSKFEIKNIENTNSNNSYKKIYKVNNDKLNHLVLEINENKKNKNLIRISASERKAKKYITFIYYLPK